MCIRLVSVCTADDDNPLPQRWYYRPFVFFSTSVPADILTFPIIFYPFQWLITHYHWTPPDHTRLICLWSSTSSSELVVSSRRHPLMSYLFLNILTLANKTRATYHPLYLLFSAATWITDKKIRYSRLQDDTDENVYFQALCTADAVISLFLLKEETNRN